MGHIELAQLARDAQVKTLVLTHLTQQLDLPGVRERVVGEMAQIFKGHILFGSDLLESRLCPSRPASWTDDVNRVVHAPQSGGEGDGKREPSHVALHASDHSGLAPENLTTSGIGRTPGLLQSSALMPFFPHDYAPNLHLLG